MPVDYLADEVEIAFEVGGIDDADNEVGSGSMNNAAEKDISGNFFVRRVGSQTVCAREIQDGSTDTIFEDDSSLFLLHSNPGVVPYLLSKTGEFIKEGGFPAIRVSDQSNVFAVNCSLNGSHQWV